MATQTTGTLPNEVKTFYDRTLLERALPRLVHALFGQRRPLARRNGKTIEFRRFSSLPAATTPLTEGVTPAGNSLTVSTVQAAIAQYGDFIEISDLLDLVAIDPVLAETAQLLGEQAGDTIDQIVRDIITAGTAVQYANGKTSRATVAAGDNLTVLEVRKAVRTLKKNNARPLVDGSFVAIVAPDTTFDLQSDAAWTDAQKYAGSTNIFSGEIGRVYGVRFVESTNAKVFTGGGAAGIDVFATMIMGQNAFGIVPLEGADLELILKPLGSSGSSDPLNQRQTAGWKVSFTAKILNDLFMVRVEHAASA